MALTKSLPSADSGTSLASSTAFTGSWVQIYYGVSGTVKLTNAGSGMVTGPTVYVDYSNDGASAISDATFVLGVGDAVNSSVNYVPIALGIGSGGDFKYMRVRVQGNSGGNVAVVANYSVTTALQ